MRLKSVKLTNFRGYRKATVIPIDEAMTGIVGRHDYGKSTILKPWPSSRAAMSRPIKRYELFQSGAQALSRSSLSFKQGGQSLMQAEADA